MSFLALLVALVLSVVWDYGRLVHRDGWYRRWQAQLGSLGLPNTPAVLLQVLVPALVAQIVLNALEPMLFHLGWIVAAVFLLLYALGRERLGTQSETYRSQCRRNDFEAALLFGQESLAVPQDAVEGRESALEVHRAMQKAYLYQALTRWFAVLFYFLLLGPAGALAYRLLCLSAENNETAAALQGYADWIPGRLAAAAFTLTGNFVESADELAAGFLQAHMTSPELLYSVAMAATGEDRVEPPAEGFGDFAARQNEAFEALLRRSGICWLVSISLLVLLF